MKRIQIAFLGLVVGLAVFWFSSEGLLTSALTMEGVFYLTGILSIAMMSFSMMLSVRPKSWEPYLGGLDKMYRLHKWLGISGIVLGLIHQQTKQGHGGPGGHAVANATEQFGTMTQYLDNLRGPAGGVAQPALYIALALVVLALIKKFPYRYFFKTHRFIAVFYLVLVFHSVVLMKFTAWPSLLGVAMGALMLGGTLAALISLFRRIGVYRKAVGVVERIEAHPGVKTIEVIARLKSRWLGHEAGQFAYVTFHQREGHHPFTITSDWKNDGAIRFIIKTLGDYTQTLPGNLKVGDTFKIEGPYGQFNFQSDAPRQIWVGGGVGIAAFVARMRALADKSDGKIIDLFHTTEVLEESAIAKLRADAKDANVRLHLIETSTQPRLTVEQICKAVPEWMQASVWFCGPTGFAHSLLNDFTTKGLSADKFHQELFDMR
jgi:predicted ferric reductase